MCVMSLILVHIRNISSASYYSMYDANTDLYLINLLLFVSVFDLIVNQYQLRKHDTKNYTKVVVFITDISQMVESLNRVIRVLGRY